MKNHNRILCFILSLIMVFSVFAVTPITAGALDDSDLASLDVDMVLRVRDAQADLIPGAAVSVPIELVKNNGYGCGVFTVEWDDAALALTGVDYTDLAPNAGSSYFSGSCNLRVGDPLSTADFVGTGTFVTLNFKVAATAEPKAHDITITRTSFQDADIDRSDRTAYAVGGYVMLTAAEIEPTEAPAVTPTSAPTTAPTEAPTAAPTEAPVTVPTDADMVLRVQDVVADLIPGTVIRIPVELVKSNGYGCGVFAISWDNAALKLKGVEYTSLAPNAGSGAIKDSGTYNMRVGNSLATTNFEGTGTFVTLKFEIAETADIKAYDISITYTSFQDSDIEVDDLTVSTIDGYVTLNEVHVKIEDSRVEATCTEDGKSYWHCSRCGEQGVDILPAPGHDYDSVATPATCTEGGYTTHTCSRCKDSYVTDETPALGHNYDSVVTPATCTEGGFTTHTCSRCKDTYVSDETPALGHDYKSVVTPATCTEGGFTTHTCSRCKDTYVSDETPAPGHDYKAVVTPPTCTEDGFTTHTCTHCGDSYTDTRVEAVGHEYSTYVETDATAEHTGVLVIGCEKCGTHTNVTLPVLGEEDYTAVYNLTTGTATFTWKDETYGVYSVETAIPASYLIIGDVNGDRKVNNRDAMILERYVANWNGYEERIPDMAAADLNGDGLVNNRDALILDRYLAEWKGYEKYVKVICR